MKFCSSTPCFSLRGGTTHMVQAKLNHSTLARIDTSQIQHIPEPAFIVKTTHSVPATDKCPRPSTVIKIHLTGSSFTYTPDENTRFYRYSSPHVIRLR